MQVYALRAIEWRRHAIGIVGQGHAARVALGGGLVDLVAEYFHRARRCWGQRGGQGECRGCGCAADALRPWPARLGGGPTWPLVLKAPGPPGARGAESPRPARPA